MVAVVVAAVSPTAYAFNLHSILTFLYIFALFYLFLSLSGARCQLHIYILINASTVQMSQCLISVNVQTQNNGFRKTKKTATATIGGGPNQE